MIFAILSAIYLGWSLGSNDAANIFGTAVSSKMLKFVTAGILASVFVILGAVLEGQGGLRTLSTLTTQDIETAGIISFGTALTITLMTVIKLPASTSQAVVGSIIGVGILQHDVNTAGLAKVLTCWILTPVGGFLVAIITYRLLAFLFNRLDLDIGRHDMVLKVGLIVAGCYGSYALGANNVANVTGVLYGADILSGFAAVLIGGAAIAFGILTFSRGVMGTVGRGIVGLDAFSALVVVVAEAVTVHVYAIIGVPVSTSQAVIGAVLGIGVLKRAEAIRIRAVYGIFTGWVCTPLIAGLLTMFIYFVLHLRYTG